MPLEVIGAPGCSLSVAPLQSIGGSATTRTFFMLAAPNDPGLVGIPLQLQALGVDSGANQLGLILSHAITTVLGSR